MQHMKTSNSDLVTSNFQLPCNRDQLRQDILQIFWHHLRTTTLFVAEEKLWPLLSSSASGESYSHGLWSLDEGPASFGVGFSQVADTMFARCLEMQFDFAYRGVLTNQGPRMELDGDHTWVALYLQDLVDSFVVEEVDAYDSPELKPAIKRCYEASGLANARLALEDREIFCYFSSPKSGEGEWATSDGLTIRQIAMLSSMEEMSVRTAVSRKGPNQLPTFKQNGRTLVRSEDARAWLKAKGRYLPITREWSGQHLRLEKTKFANLSEFDDALQEHVLYLGGVAGTAPEEFRARLRSINEAHGHGAVFNVMSYAQVEDAKLITAIADALSLPPQLLLLRAQQARLSNELQQLDWEISQLEPTIEPPASPASDTAD